MYSKFIIVFLTLVMNKSHIPFATWHSRGYGPDLINCMKQLLLSNYILFVQEHYYGILYGYSLNER